jgi:predicted RNA-binding Zn-ribbon protein involved in translation (DUF1610 family)
MKNGDYELVIAPPNYPGKLYRNKYCSKHVLVFWQAYGILPKKDEVIHHKDGNKYNNDISNLELMKRKDHVRLHKSKIGSKLVELKCPGCGKIFVRRKGQSFLQKRTKYTCCSKKCIGIVTSLSTTEFNKRVSQNFIREFVDDKTKYNLA